MGNTVPIEDTTMELFEGYGCSLLITAETPYILAKAAREFIAQSKLPLGGSEAGIEKFVFPQDTPDNRSGIICTVWVKGIKKKNQDQLKLAVFERIRNALLPQLSISVFSANPSPECHFPLDQQLIDFGDTFTKKCEKYGRTMIQIPRMGGDLWIEYQLGAQRGFMGANLFLFCKTIKYACELEEKLTQFLNEKGQCTQIYGLAASGSKLSSSSNTIPITTNHLYCPSLKEILNEKSLVSSNIESIPELVLNGYSMDNITSTLRSILKFLRNESSLLKIASSSYNSKLGLISLRLYDLI